MVIDAFMQMIMGNLQSMAAYIALAIIVIASLLAALFVFQSSVTKLLYLIQGDKAFSSGIPVGYRYEEEVSERVFIPGDSLLNRPGSFQTVKKTVSRTWTKDDEYQYRRNKRDY